MQDIAVPAKTRIKSFTRVSTLTRCLSLGGGDNIVVIMTVILSMQWMHSVIPLSMTIGQRCESVGWFHDKSIFYPNVFSML